MFVIKKELICLILSIIWNFTFGMNEISQFGIEKQRSKNIEFLQNIKTIICKTHRNRIKFYKNTKQIEDLIKIEEKKEIKTNIIDSKEQNNEIKIKSKNQNSEIKAEQNYETISDVKNKDSINTFGQIDKDDTIIMTESISLKDINKSCNNNKESVEIYKNIDNDYNESGDVNNINLKIHPNSKNSKVTKRKFNDFFGQMDKLKKKLIKVDELFEIGMYQSGAFKINNGTDNSVSYFEYKDGKNINIYFYINNKLLKPNVNQPMKGYSKYMNAIGIITPEFIEIIRDNKFSEIKLHELGDYKIKALVNTEELINAKKNNISIYAILTNKKKNIVGYFTNMLESFTMNECYFNEFFNNPIDILMYNKSTLVFIDNYSSEEKGLEYAIKFFSLKKNDIVIKQIKDIRVKKQLYVTYNVLTLSNDTSVFLYNYYNGKNNIIRSIIISDNETIESEVNCRDFQPISFFKLINIYETKNDKSIIKPLIYNWFDNKYFIVDGYNKSEYELQMFKIETKKTLYKIESYGKINFKLDGEKVNFSDPIINIVFDERQKQMGEYFICDKNFNFYGIDYEYLNRILVNNEIKEGGKIEKI